MLAGVHQNRSCSTFNNFAEVKFMLKSQHTKLYFMVGNCLLRNAES